LPLPRANITVRRSEEKQTLKVELHRGEDTLVLLCKKGVGFWGQKSPGEIVETIRQAL